MTYITALGVAHPPHQIKQTEAAAFMEKAMQLTEEEARRVRVLYKMTGIDTRYSVLADYSREQHFEFYANTNDLEPFPTTAQRMALYRQHAAVLSGHAIRNCLAPANVPALSITHLIVVSCTGMYAPGLDIDLVQQLGLSSSVKRTAITFMGCYAAFNALKAASSIVAGEQQAKVLVVCTELCTIHFQKQKTEDNFLSNALFADGSAALLVEGKPRQGLNFQVKNFFCDLASEGAQDMAWTVGDVGFEMKLSSYVPEVIRSGIKKLTNSLLQQIGHELSDVTHFAIHPGGRKILEVIEQELGLSKSQNRFAYEVLRQYGNMSSPTVLFVLHALRTSLTASDHGSNVLSFAFGPGLTLESMVLEVNHH